MFASEFGSLVPESLSSAAQNLGFPTEGERAGSWVTRTRSDREDKVTGGASSQKTWNGPLSWGSLVSALYDESEM